MTTPAFTGSIPKDAQAWVNANTNLATAKTAIATVLAAGTYDANNTYLRNVWKFLDNNPQITNSALASKYGVADDATKEANFVIAAIALGTAQDPVDVSAWHRGYTAAQLTALGSARTTAYA